MTGVIGRWRKRWRPASPLAPSVALEQVVVPMDAPAPEVLELDMTATLSAAFPAEYPLAARVTDAVLAPLGQTDLASLARHSPSLKGFEWSYYLRCSACRVVRVQHALALHVPPGGRVLDVGSYFGNFSLAAQAMGFAVEAVDGYAAYDKALAPWEALQREAGIVVHDFINTGYDLGTLGRGRFDAVICGGVVEHIPHTPRMLLETVTSVLRPGGVLILDTPNLAYLYKRLALLEGQSIFAPIAQQYYTELPFEGHHREYTVAEVDWMLQAVGHEVVSIETFNYSAFGQPRLSGDALQYHREMEADPSLREIILAVSRRA